MNSRRLTILSPKPDHHVLEKLSTYQSSAHHAVAGIGRTRKHFKSITPELRHLIGAR
jgi:hypothetical protein